MIQEQQFYIACARPPSPMTKEDERLLDWEDGLPAPEELMPLTQSLIPPDLASAFSIVQEGVQLLSQPTIASLRHQGSFSASPDKHSLLSLSEDRNFGPDAVLMPDKGTTNTNGSLAAFMTTGSVVREAIPQAGSLNQGISRSSAQLQENTPGYGDSSAAVDGIGHGALEKKTDNGCLGGTDSSDCGGASAGKKLRRQFETEYEDADSGGCLENSSEEPTARTLKRPRLVWTPQLHKRFVDAVAHLGIKNAVPKTIMQLMNVDGLTRENVASHLQKYRLYLKRMQTVSSDGHCASDQLFASTPVPPSLVASTRFLSNHREDVVSVVVPMPMAGLGHPHMVNHLGTQAPYANFEHHMYNAIARTPTQRFPTGDFQKYVLDNQGGPGSPQRQILTLFPTNGH